MVFPQQLFQLAVRLQIVHTLWGTGKRNLNEPVTIPELQAVLDCQIIVGGYMDLPPLRLQHSHVWQMKLAYMAQNRCGIEDIHRILPE